MRLRLLGLVAGAAIVVWLPVVVSSAETASPSQVRIGSAPPRPARSKVVGALPDATPLSVRVTLKPRDPAGLASYAAEVSNPGSSLHRHYLTVAQFRQRFGPTPGQIAAVEVSLRSHHLRPGAVSANGLAIPVSATAGAVARGLSLSLQRVALANGRTVFANAQAPELDASIAGLIQGVVGLDTLSAPRPVAIHGSSRPRIQSGRAIPQVVTGGAQPCPAASSAAGQWGAYTSDQFASAYKFSSLYGAGDQGGGQRIALLELEPNLVSDISAYQSCYRTSATVTYTQKDGGAGSGAGVGEAALDIEDVIGLAPKATVDVYQAPNSDAGLIDDYTAIVTDNRAHVVSTSWGECEAQATPSMTRAENTLFQEAATQGLSVFAAAGDQGSEDCNRSQNPDQALAVDDPASQPYVTGVGGTTISTLGPPPTQSVWNGNCSGHQCGTGGGISSLWTMPSYQSRAPSSLNVINVDSSGSPCHTTTGNCRQVPDVSADADPNSGYVIYYDGSWRRVGGTSAAAPLWAAFTALVNASSGCQGKPIGFANPKLYNTAANAYASVFSDITSGNNDTGTNSGKYTARTGYDMASGLGTPIGSALAASLCEARSASPPR